MGGDHDAVQALLRHYRRQGNVRDAALLWRRFEPVLYQAWRAIHDAGVAAMARLNMFSVPSAHRSQWTRHVRDRALRSRYRAERALQGAVREDTITVGAEHLFWFLIQLAEEVLALDLTALARHDMDPAPLRERLGHVFEVIHALRAQPEVQLLEAARHLRRTLDEVREWRSLGSLEYLA